MAVTFGVPEILHMDSSLWCLLPEDLMERVFARLPVASLSRLRTVSKKWSKILATKGFQEAYSEVVSYEPYFVSRYVNEQVSRLLLSFDPSVHRCRNVSIAYLPAEVGFPVSSSGGLICFINSRTSSYFRFGTIFFVSNPLTKTWKELPRLSLHRWPMMVSMIMWKPPSHYKVIVAGDGITDIFDSVEGQWHRIPWRSGGAFGGYKLAERNATALRNVTAFCNGTLYCLSATNCALLAFDIQYEVWSKVKAGRLPGTSQMRNLITCKGNLMIVSTIVQPQGVSLCVWLLDWKTMKWGEVWHMPQDMSNYLLGCTNSEFYCCSHNNLIFFASEKGVLFDMAQDLWCAVEAWPKLPIGNISFEPRFDSHV